MIGEDCLKERKASRIIIEKEVILDNRAAWSQQFDYIMDICMKMKKAFKKYLIALECKFKFCDIDVYQAVEFSVFLQKAIDSYAA